MSYAIALNSTEITFLPRREMSIDLSRNTVNNFQYIFVYSFCVLFLLQGRQFLEKYGTRGSMSGSTVHRTVLKTTEYLSLISNVGYAVWYLCKISRAYDEVRVLFSAIDEQKLNIPAVNCTCVICIQVSIKMVTEIELEIIRTDRFYEIYLNLFYESKNY